MLETNSRTILTKLPTNENILKVDKFSFIKKTDIETDIANANELDLILEHLFSVNACDIATIDDVIYVKFSQTWSRNSAKVVFLNDDKNALKLRILHSNLMQQTSELEETVRKLKYSIKTLLASGSRSQAKLQLKRMKRNEIMLEKKLTILDNVDNIVQQLDAASENKDVMQAYSAGLEALKNQLSSGKTVEETLELVDDMKEYIDQVQQISEAVSSDSAHSSETFSDAALKEELEKLINEVSVADAKTLEDDDDLLGKLQMLKVVTEDPNNLTVQERGSNKMLDISTPDCS